MCVRACVNDGGGRWRSLVQFLCFVPQNYTDSLHPDASILADY